ncbi:hypothetical protein [Vitiosangium sp. GDMCC 1.1324]|uniref:hypothetical protein n=1 Tax=Vitiosangium sp. (strain GDMCC 1.1324) TaxID=2138576 RepID=UPI000D3463CC|nr:hypothetical protein [Vitiosangium sp. GDMCC 1.1324]PTL77842.1 hypothetical protein DAT35_42330 [Vitiosangium sp. GDMCC 1.1324]
MTTPSAASKLRTICIIVVSSILVVVLVAFGARWRLEQRAHEAADVLVADARERTAAAEHVARPSHVDEPTSGTLAEALGPLMPELIALYDSQPRPSEAVGEACSDVRDGVRPLSELPRECREALEKGRSLVQRTLRTSRAAVGGLPEGLRIFDDPKHPYQRTALLPIQNILKLAALEMRFQTEQGQADAALESCLDGLALARDMGYGNALIGAMVSASGHDLLFFPCAEALDHATPGARRRAQVALRRIRASLAPFSSALRDERVYMPLLTAGWTLDRNQLDALPAGARAVATEVNAYMAYITPTNMPPLVVRALMQEAWPISQKLNDQAIAVADLPPAQRSARLVTLGRAFERSWNPFLRGDGPDYELFAGRLDKQRARLDLLLALALVKEHRAESGTWPSAPPPLYSEREVLLPTALKLQPAEGGKLLLFSEALKPEELSVTATP